MGLFPKRLAVWPLPLAMCALLAACATAPRPGQALPGMGLAASGSMLTLNWAADSPAVRLLRPGTTVEVVAAYPSAAGPVHGEALAQARVPAPAAGQQVRLSLPDTLRNAPTGPVCLRLRVAGSRALPLRAAAPGAASDGFAYPEWEQRVAGPSARKALEIERGRLMAAQQQDAEQGGDFEAWRRQLGVADAAACERVVSPVRAQARPRSALDAPARPQAAERECVWRYKQLFEQSAEPFAMAAPSIVAGQRVQQARRLLAVYQAHHAAVGAGYRPLLVGDQLKITTAAEENLERSSKLTPEFVGGVLDAFESCVRDSTEQFRISFETWQREQDPRLHRRHAELARSACRARFAGEAERSRRIAGYRAQLDEIESKILAVDAERPSRAPLPAHRSLIASACSVM